MNVAITVLRTAVRTAERRQMNFPQFRQVLQDSDCNIYLGGPAGNGKTNVISPTLCRRYGRSKVWLTAATGLAALGLGPKAATVHSQAGIGRGKDTPEQLHAAIPETAKENWCKVEVSRCFGCASPSCGCRVMLAKCRCKCVIHVETTKA